MNQKLSKKNKIIVAIVMVCLFVLFRTFSYAYFTALGVSNNATESNVLALTSNYGNVIVSYKDGNKINSENVTLIKDAGDSNAIMKFSIENTGSVAHDLTIFWQDLANNFCHYQNGGECTNVSTDTDVRNELNYTLYECTDETSYNDATTANLTGCTSNESLLNTTVPASGSQDNIHTDDFITINSETIKYYIFMLTIENKDEEQNYNQSKNMSGRIKVDFFGIDLDGTLKNANNEIMPNTVMSVFSDPITTTTDENGHFLLRNIPEGDHTLEIKTIENEVLGTNSVTILKGTSTQIASTNLVASGAEVMTNVYLEETGPVFSTERYVVTINVVNGISEENSLVLTSNETKTISVSPNSSYTLSGATLICDEGITGNISNEILTINNVQNNGACTLTLPIIQYTIKVSVTNGSSSEAQATINYNGSKTFTITPSAGYMLSGTTVSCPTGVTKSFNTSTGVLSLSNVKAGGTCTVSFSTTYLSTIVSSGAISDASVNFSAGSQSGNTNGKYYTADNTYGEDGNRIYYYRGSVSNNYVSFAGYYWRIIRTTGEGGVKLIYAGNGSENGGMISQIDYNSYYNNKYMVGYTYGGSYAGTTSTLVKSNVDSWYNSYLSSYSSYLSTTAVFCNDKTESSTLVGGTTATFNGWYRFIASSARPTFACSSTNYSRYTVSTTTGNGFLSKPAALITADEAMFAGIPQLYGSYSATDTYLHQNLSSSYYQMTMTPLIMVNYSQSVYSPNGARIAVFGGTIMPEDVCAADVPGDPYQIAVSGGIAYYRPVIALKSCILATGGNGTYASPYTLSNSGC